MNNLKLWNKVEKTNPQFTKQVSFGRKFTAIDPYYQIKQATEQFGLFGRWGLKDLEYNRIDLVDNIMFRLTAKFFYTYDDVYSEFEISTSDLLLTSKGKPDKDFFKKIETDLITKSLSRLGFNADIFMGMYENLAYVDEVARELVLISVEQRQTLAAMIQDSQTDLIKFNETFGIRKLTDLPQSEFNKAYSMLQSKINKMKKDVSPKS